MIAFALFRACVRFFTFAHVRVRNFFVFLNFVQNTSFFFSVHLICLGEASELFFFVLIYLLADGNFGGSVLTGSYRRRDRGPNRFRAVPRSCCDRWLKGVPTPDARERFVVRGVLVTSLNGNKRERFVRSL